MLACLRLRNIITYLDLNESHELFRRSDTDDADDVDDDDDDKVTVLSVQPCYRQRVTQDVLCLSDEPDGKYRTVQNVSGSGNQSFSLSVPPHLMNYLRQRWVPSDQIAKYFGRILAGSNVTVIGNWPTFLKCNRTAHHHSVELVYRMDRKFFRL